MAQNILIEVFDKATNDLVIDVVVRKHSVYTVVKHLLDKGGDPKRVEFSYTDDLPGKNLIAYLDENW